MLDLKRGPCLAILNTGQGRNLVIHRTQENGRIQNRSKSPQRPKPSKYLSQEGDLTNTSASQNDEDGLMSSRTYNGPTTLCNKLLYTECLFDMRNPSDSSTCTGSINQKQSIVQQSHRLSWSRNPRTATSSKTRILPVPTCRRCSLK